MSRRPLFKSGDIVRLRPYSDFKNHIGISVVHWNGLMNVDLTIFSIDELDSPDNIYYTFKWVSYLSWHERYLRKSTFLTDEDFDI